jgi:hypothetical protein
MLYTLLHLVFVTFLPGLKNQPRLGPKARGYTSVCRAECPSASDARRRTNASPDEPRNWRNRVTPSNLLTLSTPSLDAFRILLRVCNGLEMNFEATPSIVLFAFRLPSYHPSFTRALTSHLFFHRRHHKARFGLKCIPLHFLHASLTCQEALKILL